MELPLIAFLPFVQRVCHPVHDVGGHGGIDLARQFDETGILAKFARLPGEIERINRNAMAAQTWTWVKRHEAERFGLGRVDDLPDINPHGAIDDLEFIYEGNVDAAKRVFEQLRCLGRAAGRDRHDRFDRLGIERDGLLQAGRRIASDNLGNERNLAVGIAGVFAFGRKRQMEIAPGFQARSQFPAPRAGLRP